MSSKKMISMFLSFSVVLSLCIIDVEAQLQVGFYTSSCSLAESIVKDEKKAFNNDKGVAAGLIRMHFHDCFVRGCDASVLLDSTPSNKAEKDAPPNNPSLRDFEVIDNAKANLESSCEGVVSCADILAFAARDSVVISGGFGYDVRAGRRDGKISLSSDATPVNLPTPFSKVKEFTRTFAAKGLTQEEMVILLGAHTIGRSHCSLLKGRLYNFNGTGRQDPSLDPTYAEQLKQQCPNDNDSNNVVVKMNPSSPDIADAGYYIDVLANRGLFISDQSLLTDQATKNLVVQFSQNPLIWKNKFAAAMVKMGEIGVLTGNN